MGAVKHANDTLTLLEQDIGLLLETIDALKVTMSLRRSPSQNTFTIIKHTLHFLSLGLDRGVNRQ